MVSLKNLKDYSIFIIPILVGYILISTIKTDRPFYLISNYHFNLVEQAKTHSNSSFERTQFIEAFSHSFKQNQ